MKPRYVPPDASYDDPADKIDAEDSCESDSKRIARMTSEALTRIFEWITQKGSVTHRALRSDVVLLHVIPHFLPCQRPSAAWFAQKHGVSRPHSKKLQSRAKVTKSNLLRAN